MSSFIRYRKEIEDVWRVKPDEATRLEKLRLDKNERISPFPQVIWKEFINGISEEMVQAYPEVFPLYKRLAGFHNLEIDNILLTAGSDAAIRHCFEVFVNPGDRVIYLDPTFAMVTVYGGLFGARMAGVSYDSTLKTDAEKIMGLIDKDTALIIMANPNSPTGTYLGNDAVCRIADAAAQHRVPLLIDEAYYGFCPYTALEIMADHPNIIVARTFSKVAGMAGLRVGYALGHRDVISLLTRFRPMYEVNSLGLLMACKVIDNWHLAEEYARETVRGRERLEDFFIDIGFSVIRTMTNFIHVDFGTLKTPILEALASDGVLVRGMLNIDGLENYTRLSVGPWDAMSKVVGTIQRIMDDQR